MSTVNAKIYIARILGGESSQEALDMAGEALLRTYQDWQTRRLWGFLLKDTSTGASVAVSTVPLFSTVLASDGSLDFLNIGQTVTYSGTNTVLPPGTTITGLTRGSNGSVTVVQLSAAFSGVSVENGTLTVADSNIPIIQGVNDYSLPADFYVSYTARLLTLKRTLTWRDPRYWDRTMDRTIQGAPSEYTTYNPQSENTQNFGTDRLTLDRVPSAADTMFLRYYRKFNPSATNVDVPDMYLYQFLDDCRRVLLLTKLAQDDPQGYAQMAAAGTEGAAEADEDRTDDDDANTCMKSQYEIGMSAVRPLWGNGPFDPFY